MSESDIEARVTALEERLGMESGLRAAQDRDLGDMAGSLRAQTHLIQALAITQGQHTEKLGRLAVAVDRHGAMLAEHGERLDRVQGGVTQIISMLNQLIDRDPGE